MNKTQKRKSPYSKNESCYKKRNAKSIQKILKNIQKLYRNSKSNQKINISAINSNVLSRIHLNKMGFGTKQKIYLTSKRKAENI